MSFTESATAKVFDYSASADLFSMKNRNGRRQPMSYKHFESAAEAIRYAIEEIPTQNLVGTLLEVDELTLRQQGNPCGCTRARVSRWQERL